MSGGASAMSNAIIPPTTTVSYSQHDETRAYVGFQWFTGETSLSEPHVVLGLRQTKTETSNKVTGYDLSYTYSLEKSRPEALRLAGLDGKCSNGLALAGLGYSFSKSAVLGFAGVAGSYTRAFGEIDSNKQLGAALELNSMPCAGDRDTTTVTKTSLPPT